MMLQPTSGRRGFGYVNDPIDKKGKYNENKSIYSNLICIIILVTSFDQQDLNVTTPNTSNEVNKTQQQKPNISEQATDAIKKAKD
jgi:hypothetical protein